MKVLNRRIHGIPKGSVDISRNGPFGNPIKLKPGDKPGSTLNQYREYLEDKLKNDSKFKDMVKALYGKDLVCWCKPNPCHGDILLEACLRLNKD